jgi:hypothetical protein
MRWRLFAAAAVIGACRSALAAGQPAAAPEPVQVSRFDDRIAGFSQTSGFRDAVRLVVRDTGSWRRAWAQMNARFFPQPPLPSVDFSRETVLLAALGARSSGGYEIHIDSAARLPDGVEVTVRSVLPADGCTVAAVYTQPVDVAKIPAGPLPVRFREQTASVSCRR